MKNPRRSGFMLLGVVRFALLALHFVVASVVAESGQATFTNPICQPAADPWFIRHGGKYIACFTEGDRGIAIHQSDRLTVLGPKQVVWRAPESGPASRQVWAPELHFLDGRWFIYFAASDGENRNHRMWALRSAGKNPAGPYTLHGPLYTGDDPHLVASNRWAIDLTVLELAGRRYAVWSGWAAEDDVQHLYLAPMKDPLTLAAPRVQLCANDDFLWERVDENLAGRGLHEAPQILQRDGRTFLIYSCSGSWQTSYKLGLLELKPGGNPLSPADWRKHSQPVFQSTAATWGVGHCSFVKSPDGREDWLLYHAKLDRTDGWRRAVFAQPFHWTAVGWPQFGEPVAAGARLPLPAGEKAAALPGRQ